MNKDKKPKSTVILILAPQLFTGELLPGFNSIFGVLPETELGGGGEGGESVGANQLGAVLGVATFSAVNQLVNPCGQNRRFVSPQEAMSAGQGFLTGFAGASLVNTLLGGPCL